MTKVVGFYGGPGTGKSTRAAGTYASLKDGGVNSELVREYVKDWAWQGKKIGKYDQMYFLVQQFKRESILYNKVDYVITDSPFILAGFYAEYYLGQSFIAEAAMQMREIAKADGVEFVDIFLTRGKKYLPNGRYETEEEAIAIDGALLNFLNKYNVNYQHLDISQSYNTKAVLEKIGVSV